jgi:hypothetical protein
MLQTISKTYVDRVDYREYVRLVASDLSSVVSLVLSNMVVLSNMEEKEEGAVRQNNRNEHLRWEL